MNRKLLAEMLQFQTDVIWTTSCRMYPRLRKFSAPTIRLCARLWRTAGLCYQEENSITLAYKFFLHSDEYRQQMLQVILPHEIAHQVDFNLYGISEEKTGHGRNWQQIMLDYGLEPSPYHTMEISR